MELLILQSINALKLTLNSIMTVRIAVIHNNPLFFKTKNSKCETKEVFYTGHFYCFFSGEILQKSFCHINYRIVAATPLEASRYTLCNGGWRKSILHFLFQEKLAKLKEMEVRDEVLELTLETEINKKLIEMEQYRKKYARVEE